MKLFLVFALCGVACCLAGPTCSKDELSKCPKGRPGPPGTVEEELEDYCKTIKCVVEIYERCGTQVFAVGPFPVKGYRRVVDALCDRSNPLRQKYLDTAKCFGAAVPFERKMRQMLKKCDIVERPKEEFCRKIPDGFRCAVDYISGKCGKDAGEVVQVAFLPFLDPYDCLSS